MHNESSAFVFQFSATPCCLVNDIERQVTILAHIFPFLLYFHLSLRSFPSGYKSEKDQEG